jgi:hypothetical protein
MKFEHSFRTGFLLIQYRPTALCLYGFTVFKSQETVHFVKASKNWLTLEERCRCKTAHGAKFVTAERVSSELRESRRRLVNHCRLFPES